MKLSTIFLTVFSLCFCRSVYAKQDIVLWRHMAGDIHIQSSLDSIARFNASQSKWRVVPDFIPETAYTLSIKAAAKADLLPCVIQIDQPTVSNFAWNGFIEPLDGLFGDLLTSINSSGKGVYRGKVYSVGAFDVSLALFTTKSLIKKIGARYPTVSAPWDKNEFMAFLDAIKKTGDYKYPLDMQAQNRTEWIPYAWGALMMSWGGDLIDRNDYLTVEGVLNSRESIQFGDWIQLLVNENYIDANPKNNNAFIEGDIGVQYSGSWDLTAYDKAFKDDLAVLPLPNFGHGTVSGGGSWQWAITKTCRYPEAAKEIIAFFMSPKEQSFMSTDVEGVFPTNSEAAEITENYSKNGKWRMLYEFSKEFAVLRPATPAYTEISASYRKAMIDILNGMQPKIALSVAVENINVAFERHQNYRHH